MGAGGNSGGGGTGPQELGKTTRDKRSEKEKQKDANVELGLGKDRMSNYSQNEGGTRDEGNNNKSAEQPKVKSQTNAVKPDLVPDGPTDVEMTEDELALERKKRGRKRTVLTSITGDTSRPQLSNKTLLG